MVAHAKSLKMTVEEYIALDEASDERWEYVNGEAYAMAGGTSPHALVSGRLYRIIGNILDSKPCAAFNMAQKIATVRTGAYHFADASIVCPPFAKDVRAKEAMTSPVAIFEVLSPNTRDYDQGGKFVHYRTIDTLRDYVLIDPDTREVEHRRVIGRKHWEVRILNDGTLELPSAGVAFAIAELWKDLDKVIAGS